MVAGILLALVSDATAQQRPYSPLGDLMTMTVQPRHAKLGLAGREANWRYADYELHELNEAFDRAAKAWPSLAHFLDPRDASIGHQGAHSRTLAGDPGQDPGRFATAYEQLTEACNTCHRSADRDMIVIQPPQASPCPNLDLRPAKE
jgi:hypothetical protein